ncbi:MAG: hypothetical protein NT062_28295 [Proteobacteria bacterium]|nr:hypothetical protein [Pseudomonadota bacterium]
MVRPTEQRLAGEQLPRDDAEREHVGRRGGRLADRLLRGHVARLAAEPAPLERRRERRPRDPEIEDLHVAVGRQHDVRRRHVAVHDAERAAVPVGLAVRVVEARGGLRDDVGGDRDGAGDRLARGLGHRGAQVLALDQLHRQEQLAVGLPEVEDLHDVAVRELDGDARLVDEAADEPAFAGGARQDPLERLDLLEPGDADGLDLVDLGHPPLRDLLEHVVLAETLA